MKPGDRIGGQFVRGRVMAPVLGRIVKKPDPKPAPENETIRVHTLPTSITALVYKSDEKPGWISSVVLEAIDVENKQPGYFGSEWTHPEKPTREQIREQIVDMFDHELRHQLGLEAHPKEPT